MEGIAIILDRLFERDVVLTNFCGVIRKSLLLTDRGASGASHNKI